jgi:uncharacterized protein
LRIPTHVRVAEALSIQTRPMPAAGRSRLTRGLSLLALVATVVASCQPGLPASEREWRDARQRMVADATPPGKTVPELRFYAFDRSARLRTLLVPVEPPEALSLGASDGSVRPAHRVGRVLLRLGGGEATLALFRLDDLARTEPDHLFLPFRDAAAGRDTYGAGRYVELERRPSGVVEIDFNRAYNPDCAYGMTAQCPVTPAENNLPFVVRAGEMTPVGAGH